ncbi:aspartate/glutamate racemase family protein [Paenibacillus sp. GCM10023250]|uniref:aspartate/glutamate racemase family protein n=1 Tax=Paenibacillus sp. GCM10023250 TaxID=3252648 RepID=UPI003611C721
MKRRIGCLHAHYSNIAYIEHAISSDDLEWIHFVDPGLMSRITSDNNFDEAQAKNKVLEQIEWIAQANVEAILITCTTYIALLEENRLHTSIPILKMDEPFFNSVCRITAPQVLLFTNPATVEGTMGRLKEYASTHGMPIRNIEARIIENTFELLMRGEKERYVEELSTYIKKILVSEKDKKISVAQLSMVEAAYKVERELAVKIGNPLDSLISHFGKLFLN